MEGLLGRDEERGRLDQLLAGARQGQQRHPRPPGRAGRRQDRAAGLHPGRAPRTCRSSGSDARRERDANSASRPCTSCSGPAWPPGCPARAAAHRAPAGLRPGRRAGRPIVSWSAWPRWGCWPGRPPASPCCAWSMTRTAWTTSRPTPSRSWRAACTPTRSRSSSPSGNPRPGPHLLDGLPELRLAGLARRTPGLCWRLRPGPRLRPPGRRPGSWPRPAATRWPSSRSARSWPPGSCRQRPPLPEPVPAGPPARAALPAGDPGAAGRHPDPAAGRGRRPHRGSRPARGGPGRNWGSAAEAAAPAEARQLITIRDVVRFRHPLIRSAVYYGASFAQRQQHARRLAAADRPSRAGPAGLAPGPGGHRPGRGRGRGTGTRRGPGPRPGRLDVGGRAVPPGGHAEHGPGRPGPPAAQRRRGERRRGALNRAQAEARCGRHLPGRPPPPPASPGGCRAGSTTLSASPAEATVGAARRGQPSSARSTSGWPATSWSRPSWKRRSTASSRPDGATRADVARVAQTLPLPPGTAATVGDLLLDADTTLQLHGLDAAAPLLRRRDRRGPPGDRGSAREMLPVARRGLRGRHDPRPTTPRLHELSRRMETRPGSRGR